MRADARRNYERIVATARDAFAEHGVDVPLDDIAKRAQVGAGTLYRHFPSRDALIEAVYRDEIMKLADRARGLADELPPEEALTEWMREQVRFVIERQGFAATLKATMDKDSPTFAYCKTQLNSAAGELLTRAQETGRIRADLRPTDLLRLAHGVGTASTYADAEGAEVLLAVMLAGIRTPAG